MVQHGTSLELPLEYQQDYLTPTERFFVCNSGSSPDISTRDYVLRFWGNGVTREHVLNFSDLEAMPQYQVAAVIECAGNHRAFFHEVDGRQIETPPGTAELIWSTGAVGMALWEGVRLADVLQKVGMTDQARFVCATGSELDSVEGRVRMTMPLEKAIDQHTLLALKMNSLPLSPDHGYPVRVLVPGWIGAYSVKWVQDIEISENPIWVRRNTASYVMMGEAWPAEKYAPSKGQPLTHLNIKSALALPRPAFLTRGTHRLTGFARSPGQKIASVHWSDDGGDSWFDASLTSDNEIYGWVRFAFDWTAHPGKYKLMTKAVDASGEVQPDAIPFNSAGYLYNAIHPHPIIVAD
ncbi:MAG: molybdopterin-dependent oxidoreductase [Granulosicoccus sp.]